MVEIEFITFACNDSEQLAEFWSAALGGERRELPASLDPEIVDCPGNGPDLLFKEQPKGTERDLPIHLDVSTENREETVEQLRNLGGSVRETKTEAYETHTATWTVMEDPEGNGFCVSEYQQ
ncbi:VOC family protein [Haloferax sp. KTX1]|uniref:VOC family protein n=1 Tax=Haloferax sp. KTX1 TaxID=2600597 RepID=UPI0011DDEB4D|nr:VOC family protein [Haloferax sp. KTX1]